MVILTYPVIHVYPEDDIQEHVTDESGECWCNPKYDPEFNIIVHNALDEREKYELDEKNYHD